MLDLAIISGGCPLQFRLHENHRAFAKYWKIPYYLDEEPRNNLQTPHFHKIAATLDRLGSHEWIMWIDDDAAFMDFKWDVRSVIISGSRETFFHACKSPINPQGGWTFLSAGQFLIKNCRKGHEFLELAFNTPKAKVEQNWRPDVYGMLTPGEQSHIIHILHHYPGFLEQVELHPWQAFNARPYHWHEGAPADLYPLVHFPGDDKPTAISKFAARFGLQNNLLRT